MTADQFMQTESPFKAAVNAQGAPDKPEPAVGTLTIGKVAQMAQVTTDTVRHYEREGLLCPVQKSGAGYRLYNEEAVRRLNFIKHAQHCGLSLAEIRELLDLKGRGNSCCSDVRNVAIQKQLQVESKIRALQAMSKALSGLIKICTNDQKPLDECPILATLESSLKDAPR